MEKNNDFRNKFILRHNIKDLENKLVSALKNLQIQEFNLVGKDTENDFVFKLLKDKEREELLKFFNSNKSSFINSLPINGKNISNFNEQISALINTEMLSMLILIKSKKKYQKSLKI